MQDIMDFLHITRKGRMMVTLEKFYIFRETKLNNQISDRLAIKPNIIFESIVRHNHYRGLPNSYTQDSQQPASVLQYYPSSSGCYKAFQGNIQQVIHPYHWGPRKINTNLHWKDDHIHKTRQQRLHTQDRHRLFSLQKRVTHPKFT